jgi:carbon-monoxide dehydrogenase large subunit
VVEIDPETGEIEIARMLTVDDCGRVINPLLVEGQIHGGIAQGIGQALFEGADYDEQGNLLTGTLMEYAVPRAGQLPSFECHRTETPTPLNALGVKGVGEAATIGSTPAVVNAVVDALSHLGVRHIDTPLTPEKIWRIVRGAAKRG